MRISDWSSDVCSSDLAKEIKNIGASVRARLLNLSKANGQSFDLVLTRFALERLLFRLSQSPHADRFVLKGAMLMMSWFDDPHRGTREIGRESCRESGCQYV